ncbi:hypothetical protein [Olivibacter sp. SDN3]|nr:hypothetical protein [Olivibacter sp. SDN3]
MWKIMIAIMLGLACPPKKHNTNKNKNSATVMTGGEGGHVLPTRP